MRWWGGAIVLGLALLGCSHKCPDDDDGKCKRSGKESLQPAAQEPGYLVVMCEPACDDVSDNGASLGPSPIVRVPVKPGAHTLALRSGAVKRELATTVEAGQTTAQRVKMVATTP